MIRLLRHKLVLLVLLLLAGQAVPAQDKKQIKAEKKLAAQSALKSAIENRRYNFIARNMTPAGGRNRILTTPYSLALRGDSLDADLPYFGRAYSANIGSTDNSIRFVTTAFSYTTTPGKKDGWEIVLVPQNQFSASRIYISISSSGTATVSVQSNNRQAISFFGEVMPNKRQ